MARTEKIFSVVIADMESLCDFISLEYTEIIRIVPVKNEAGQFGVRIEYCYLYENIS